MFVIAMFLAVLVGVSLGMLGGGGSILTVPILKYVIGLEAHQAVAASLFVVGATSASALIPHARRGRVRFRTGIIFGLAGMVGAFFAGRLAKHVPAGLLLVLFAVMMFVTAVAMLRGRKTADGAAAVERELPIAKVIAEGLVVGAVTGLVGAGGGFLVVPALVLLGGLPMDVAVGTSLLVIAMKSFAGFAGYVTTTTIDWKLLLALTFFAIIGSAIGGHLAGKVDQAKLRRAFGWFVIVMALYMLAQEVPPLLGMHIAPFWPWVVAAVATLLVTVVPRLFARDDDAGDKAGPAGGPGPAHSVSR